MSHALQEHHKVRFRRLKSVDSGTLMKDTEKTWSGDQGKKEERNGNKGNRQKWSGQRKTVRRSRKEEVERMNTQHNKVRLDEAGQCVLKYC